jgi:hypothetical protein
MIEASVTANSQPVMASGVPPVFEFIKLLSSADPSSPLAANAPPECPLNAQSSESPIPSFYLLRPLRPAPSGLACFPALAQMSLKDGRRPGESTAAKPAHRACSTPAAVVLPHH